MERRSRIYPSIKPSVIVEWTMPRSDRKALRRAIAVKWSEEDPHTSYRNNVELTLVARYLVSSLRRIVGVVALTGARA